MSKSRFRMCDRIVPTDDRPGRHTEQQGRRAKAVAVKTTNGQTICIGLQQIIKPIRAAGIVKRRSGLGCSLDNAQLVVYTVKTF